MFNGKFQFLNESGEREVKIRNGKKGITKDLINNTCLCYEQLYARHLKIQHSVHKFLWKTPLTKMKTRRNKTLKCI